LLLLGLLTAVFGAAGAPPDIASEVATTDAPTALLLVLQAEPADGMPVTPDALAAAARTIQRRAEAFGIAGAEVWTSGDDQIVVKLPGVAADAADDAVRRLTTTALLEIIDPQGAFLPEGTIVTTSLGGPTGGASPAAATVYTTIVSGADLEEASETINQFGQPVVQFTLTDDAAERFFEYTSTHIGLPLSIAIDKVVVSSPVVNAAISDQGIIEGLPAEEVPILVSQLNSGALAVPLTVVTSLVLDPAPPASSPSADTATPVDAMTPIAAGGCWTADQWLGGDPPRWTDPPAMAIDRGRQYTATFVTSRGDFTVDLFPGHAPLAVNNFVCLARAGYYDGTTFHRVIKDFVIQGGDPTGTGRGGPGYTFPDEPIERDYQLGTLAMANAGPNTNGGQFFIVVGEAGTELPKTSTIFGQVVAGMVVIDRIAQGPTTESDFGERSKPVEPVTIETILIEEH
jgi:peptidylprolyl isomerase